MEAYVSLSFQLVKAYYRWFRRENRKRRFSPWNKFIDNSTKTLRGRPKLFYAHRLPFENIDASHSAVKWLIGHPTWQRLKSLLKIKRKIVNLTTRQSPGDWSENEFNIIETTFSIKFDGFSFWLLSLTIFRRIL